MVFNVPDTAGQRYEVRLYFANRNNAPAAAGARRFHIDLEGTRVATNFDVVAATGHNRGTMRSFQITGDGNLDLDLVRSGTGTNNYPLINGIEILSNDPAPPSDPVVKRGFDGTAPGSDSVVPTGALAPGATCAARSCSTGCSTPPGATARSASRPSTAPPTARRSR